MVLKSILWCLVEFFFFVPFYLKCICGLLCGREHNIWVVRFKKRQNYEVPIPKELEDGGNCHLGTCQPAAWIRFTVILQPGWIRAPWENHSHSQTWQQPDFFITPFVLSTIHTFADNFLLKPKTELRTHLLKMCLWKTANITSYFK